MFLTHAWRSLPDLTGACLLAQSRFGGFRLDTPAIMLLLVVVSVLAIAYVVGQILKRQPETSVNPAVVQMFNQRIRGWWMLCAILIAAFLIGQTATVFLFFCISFFALREFITITPTRLGDHRALFWVFFALAPLQYVLVGMGPEYHGLYSILIPVYGFLFIPARVALSGDYKRFLERTAKIQSGLLVCVYSLSYAPALLDLDLQTQKVEAAASSRAQLNPNSTTPIDSAIDSTSPVDSDSQAAEEPGRKWHPWSGSRAGLLFYFVLLAQLSDVFQYVWSKLLGRRVIAPAINASKTWEGFFAGAASTTLVGTLLWWATPFTIWQSACMSLVIAIMGFAGSMTMSAIKRDRGVKDYGTLVEGHAGVLDRVDSICFAAPVFFHLTRYYFMLLPLELHG